MTKRISDDELLSSLPLQARVILETCYDIMDGSPRLKGKSKGYCTHIEIHGAAIRYVDFPGLLGKGVDVSAFMDPLIQLGLMDQFGPGKFKPTKRGFQIGKLASEMPS